MHQMQLYWLYKCNKNTVSRCTCIQGKTLLKCAKCHANCFGRFKEVGIKRSGLAFWTMVYNNAVMHTVVCTSTA